MSSYSAETEHEVAQQIVGAGYLAMSRRISAAIVEFFDMVGKLGDTLQDEPGMAHFVKRLRQARAAATRNAQFQFAARLRNRSTNHYDAAELSDLSSRFEDEHEFHFYLHRAGGNSSFPFAEEIALVGEFLHPRSSHTNIDAWLDWIHKTSQSGIALHHRIIWTVIEKYVPEFKGVERKVPIETRMVFRDDDHLPFMFFRTSDVIS